MVTRVQMADAEEELPLAPRGTYQLAIKRFEKKRSQKGNTFFNIVFTFTDAKHPSFRQSLFAPTPEDDDTRAEDKVRQFVRLLKAFDIPFDGSEGMEEFEPTEDDCIGAVGDVTVFIGTDKDEDGEEYEVNKIALGAPRRYKNTDAS